MYNPFRGELPCQATRFHILRVAFPFPAGVADEDNSDGRIPWRGKPFTTLSAPGKLPIMYKCKSFPIRARKAKRTIEQARRFIEQWRKESRGSRPYVRVICGGLKGKVFIDDFHYHIEDKDYGDMVGRYRLVPCVRELLRKTRDVPTATADGNLMLDGITRDGTRFRVIIRPEKRGGCLQSFYPL